MDAKVIWLDAARQARGLPLAPRRSWAEQEPVVGRTWLARAARARLGSSLGARVTAESEPGPAPWVEIEADSLLDCDMAEQRLEDIVARKHVLVPNWESGWDLATNYQGQLSFRIRLCAIAPRSSDPQ